MTANVQEPILIAVDADTEHRYQEYLRIVEVYKVGEVSRTLHRRVRKFLRSYSWHVVHCEEVDPAPLAWLTRIAKLGVNLGSIQLVSLDFSNHPWPAAGREMLCDYSYVHISS